MVNYNLIKNLELQQLIALSPSMQGLPASRLARMIEKISALPAEGQRAIIDQLEKERMEMGTGNQLRQVEKDIIKVESVKHGFDAEIRREKTQKEMEKSDEEAANLLKNL